MGGLSSARTEGAAYLGAAGGVTGRLQVLGVVLFGRRQRTATRRHQLTYVVRVPSVRWRNLNAHAAFVWSILAR